LRAVDIPIVAPSANLSRHVSPTTAKHVYDDFAGKLPLILDGGACEGGIESTVCDVTGEVPVILRPGLITKEMIEAVVGRCETYVHDPKSKEKVKSPGVLYKHYAPRCKTVLLPSKSAKSEILAYIAECKETKGIAVLCEEKWICDFENLGVKCLNLGKNQAEMAMRLYGLLREAEGVCEVLFVVDPEEKTGVMEGVLNRLYKACASEDIKH
jgi:L-threonylcarbamoyladenylate synthase